MKFFVPLTLFFASARIAAACSSSWKVNLNKGGYKDFGECQRRGPVELIWRTIGTKGDYAIRLRKSPFPGYSEKEWEFNVPKEGGVNHKINAGGRYYMTFVCDDCEEERGLFEYKFVECGCPNGWIKTSACVKNTFEDAKNAQCEAPPPPPSPYIFKYEVQDIEFESIDVQNINTEKISSSSNGIIKNCADGSTADHELFMSLAIENSQSMTVSKAFTTSETSEFATSVSVEVKAEAGAIFAKASVAATAGFEFSKSFETSTTDEVSTTLETTSEIGFEFASRVSVKPNTCVEYTLSSHVSSEPLEVPFKTKIHLTIYYNDEDQKQVTDFETLTSIQENVLIGYDSTIDTVSRKIKYSADGVFTGLYATEADTETSNCDKCGSVDAPRSPEDPSSAPSSPENPSSAPSSPENPSSAPSSPENPSSNVLLSIIVNVIIIVVIIAFLVFVKYVIQPCVNRENGVGTEGDAGAEGDPETNPGPHVIRLYNYV